MRILVLAPSLREAGGIQRYTRILVRALGDLIGEGHVALRTIPQRRPAPGGHAPVRMDERVRFVSSALAEAVLHRPAVVICTHVAVAPVGWLIGRLGRIPYWVVGYGVEVWGALPVWKRRALREAQRVMVVSRFTRERLLQRHRVPEERVVVIPTPLDDGLVRIRPDECWLKAWGLAGRPIILTVGRLAGVDRYKGHDTVIQALPRVLEQVPDAHYLIVGDGDDRLRLTTLAASLGIADRVVFAGRVDDARLAAAYRACDVFVMPARTVVDDRVPQGEGFGIVYLEAMAFGKPVIGPKVGAPAEFIRHGEHGLLVDPESPDEVAQALQTLLTHPEEAKRMGERARSWVTSEFSYERFRERIGEGLKMRNCRIIRESCK